jgi:hypothetical protein
VTYFAYPFGLWNKEVIPKEERISNGLYTVSQKRFNRPLYTIRRMIVSGTWTTEGMMNATESTLINDFIETSSLKNRVFADNS